MSEKTNAGLWQGQCVQFTEYGDFPTLGSQVANFASAEGSRPSNIKPTTCAALGYTKKLPDSASFSSLLFTHAWAK
eukprot:CAMPEP_0175850660 /NCGR_PEP_ID=MMETSP0107_2-20121207/25222_1 /TAXON_ID=195067 ORGANISM="Goniomonas pacifica, Strain CCMP1869" /NCGR_SAMPLE_ID=MMETSP0107_2 /ASSEMBLY_ACC=CAM_ASM_000203 /LENGTH=75 /DNA_ID=CAMNT_0017165991 /DNA_START=45 /DNA_END=272 /DNA_ORIENTATION=+